MVVRRKWTSLSSPRAKLTENWGINQNATVFLISSALVIHGTSHGILPCSWFSFPSSLFSMYFSLPSGFYPLVCLLLSFIYFSNLFPTAHSNFVHLPVKFQVRALMGSVIPLFCWVDFYSCTLSWPLPSLLMAVFGLDTHSFAAEAAVRVGGGVRITGYNV